MKYLILAITWAVLLSGTALADDVNDWNALMSSSGSPIISIYRYDTENGECDTKKSNCGVKEIVIRRPDGKKETIATFDRSGNRTDKGCE